MRCQRCHGFMTVDAYIDLGSSGNSLWLRVWRCVNCGKVYEPGILMNRAAHRNWLHRPVKRFAGNRLLRDDVMALTA
jgi:hypothetical protein